jgi:CheY-like chemotaxis protein/cell division septation protein DedD
MAVNSIVLVENDAATVKTIQETLEHTGYAVHVFDDPGAGLNQAKEILPSLIFINLSAPGTNGLEICKTIHHDESLANVPIVLLTIREGKFDPIYTKLYGIVAFVKKPFEIHELLAVAQEFSPLKPAPPGETAPIPESKEEPQIPLSDLEEEAGEVLYGKTGFEEEEEGLDEEEYGVAFSADSFEEQEDTPFGEEPEEVLPEESEEKFIEEAAPSPEELFEAETEAEREREEEFVPSLSYPEEKVSPEQESSEVEEDEVEEPSLDEDIFEMPEELSGEATETPGYAGDEELADLLQEPAAGQRGEGREPEDDVALDEDLEESPLPAAIEDVRGRRTAPRKSRLAPILVLLLLVGLVSFSGFYFFFTDDPYKVKDTLAPVQDALSRVPYLGALISGDEETVVTEKPALPAPPSAETVKETERKEPAAPEKRMPSGEPAAKEETVLSIPQRVIGEEKPHAVSPAPPAPKPPKKVASKTRPVSAYYIQFGAFSSDPNANRFAKKLENRGLDVFIKRVKLKSGKELNYVLLTVGYGSQEEAEKKAAAIKKEKRVETAVFH